MTMKAETPDTIPCLGTSTHRTTAPDPDTIQITMTTAAGGESPTYTLSLTGADTLRWALGNRLGMNDDVNPNPNTTKAALRARAARLAKNLRTETAKVRDLTAELEAKSVELRESERLRRRQVAHLEECLEEADPRRRPTVEEVMASMTRPRPMIIPTSESQPQEGFRPSDDQAGRSWALETAHALLGDLQDEGGASDVVRLLDVAAWLTEGVLLAGLRVATAHAPVETPADVEEAMRERIEKAIQVRLEKEQGEANRQDPWMRGLLAGLRVATTEVRLAD